MIASGAEHPRARARKTCFPPATSLGGHRSGDPQRAASAPLGTKPATAQTREHRGSRVSYRGHRATAGDEDLVLADEAVIADPANVHPGRARFPYRVNPLAVTANRGAS